MAIEFEYGWDGDGNHTSGRSQDEVERLIREVPSLQALSYDHSNGAVGMAIQMDFKLQVTKGIHDDSHGKHITIVVPQTGRTWHLYLKKISYRGSSFVWQVDEIR
jgi:hypothetical protein